MEKAEVLEDRCAEAARVLRPGMYTSTTGSFGR